MSYMLRTVHFISLGLWLGGVTFFSFFTALPIITRMQELANTPGNWPGFTTEAEGTRIAGEALTVVFERYFPYQAVCGAVALLTSLPWLTQPGLVNKLRPVILAVALVLVMVNLFCLAPWIHQLRIERYTADSALAEEANRAFGALHGISLLADMLTLALVFVAMTFAARLNSGRGAHTPLDSAS